VVALVLDRPPPENHVRRVSVTTSVPGTFEVVAPIRLTPHPLPSSVPTIDRSASGGVRGLS
jgi:hypothetical protein